MASKSSSTSERLDVGSEPVTMHTIADMRQPNLARSVHQLLRGEDKISVRAIPRSMERTCLKRGFHLNILVAGRYDLGQEDLIETLFGVQLNRPQDPSAYDGIAMKEDQTAVSDGPVKLHLKVITTPNFGLRLDETNSWRVILNNVTGRLHTHLHKESQLMRKQNTPDERVHACLYLFPPAGPLIMPNDRELLRRLTQVCNVIPVIARADMLTVKENLLRKQQVHEALKGYRIFQMPLGEKPFDEDEWIVHLQKIASRQPFACPGKSRLFLEAGEHMMLDPNDDTYSDTPTLRAAFIAHMCELVDSTHYVFYEEYRANALTNRYTGDAPPNERFSLSLPGDHAKNEEVEMVDQELYNFRTNPHTYMKPFNA